MEYIPSFRDDLHVDIQPSFIHSFRDEHDAKMMYGLPKVKKFPMPDAEHVKSAIRFFNYAKPSQERELANAILDRIADYGIDPDDINVGDDNRFKKYLQHSYLAHHGIKGMHWGVRRYQNPDGSLTNAGRKRRGSTKNQHSHSKRKMSLDDKAIAKVIIGSALVGGVAAGIGTVYTTNSDATKELDILTGPVAMKSCDNMARKTGAYQALLDRAYTLKSLSNDKLFEMRNNVERDIETARGEADTAYKAYNRLLDNSAIKIAMKASKKTRDKMEQAGQAVVAVGSNADKMAIFGTQILAEIEIEARTRLKEAEGVYSRKEYKEWNDKYYRR